jgi:hypothetical protein
MDNPLIGYTIGALIFLWLRSNGDRFQAFGFILIILFIGAFIILLIYAGSLCLLAGKIVSGLVLIVAGISVLRWLIN